MVINYLLNLCLLTLSSDAIVCQLDDFCAARHLMSMITGTTLADHQGELVNETINHFDPNPGSSSVIMIPNKAMWCKCDKAERSGREMRRCVGDQSITFGWHTKY